MELKDFVLAVFEQNKKPEELSSIKPVKNLSEIHDLVTLFFVQRHKGLSTVSALAIEQYFSINKEFAGVIKGEWDLGGYLESEKRFFSMGTYPIDRFSRIFVTQERLDKDEVYMKDYLTELFQR
jgi:hypothetical protein